ncbi:MAG: LamG domain-containing protein, partial [Halanaerobium sp.]
INKARSTEDRFGNKDSALSFKEKEDFLKLPVNINPEKMPKLTVALWLKVEDYSGISTIFSNSDGSFARSLVIDGRKNRPLLSVSAGSDQQVYGGMSIQLNKWIFTAVSWNAETGKVSLYLADQNKNFSSISTNNINPKNNNDFIRLAKSPIFEDSFTGSMDQLMIWDQVLSVDEIKSLVD